MNPQGGNLGYGQLGGSLVLAGLTHISVANIWISWGLATRGRAQLVANLSVGRLGLIHMVVAEFT